jgi:hypothetical protein
MSCPSGELTHLGVLKNAKRPNSIKKNATTPKYVSVVPQMMMCHVSENNSFHKD